MTNWKIRDKDTDRVWQKDSRRECEEAIKDFGDEMNLEVVSPEGSERANVTEDGAVVEQGGKPNASTDGGAEVVNPPEDDVAGYDLPDKPPVDTDPLTWMPKEFTDTIDGTVAINRKGFSVLKQHYDIDCESDCIVGPEENDFTFCRVKAKAVTPEGTTSEAHGSAHVDRGDDPWLLLEMADTRAKKRAISDATGVGMVAVEELMNE